MSNQILKLPEVIELTRLSRSSIYAYIKADSFPKQIKLSERCVGWLRSDVDNWIESKILSRKEA